MVKGDAVLNWNDGLHGHGKIFGMYFDFMVLQLIILVRPDRESHYDGNMVLLIVMIFNIYKCT